MLMRITGKTITTCLIGLSLMAATWSLPAMSQAATVSQLDITGGSVDLNFGPLGHLAGSFTTNGQLIMNQFQPVPNIFDPVTAGHLSFSLFTSSGGPLGLPAPSAETSGAVMTADLRSLFANAASTGWAGILTGPSTVLPVSLNVGGVAAGSFNESTKAFDISWTRSFTGIPSLSSGTFSFQGTAQLAAVPLPGAVFLFGSGMAGLLGMTRRKSRSKLS